MEKDTTALLRYCDSGAKTAVSSIKEVLDNVKGKDLLKLLSDSTIVHEEILGEIKSLLTEKDIEEKNPSPVAKMMSFGKINLKLMMDDSDKQIAALIYEGCDMGIKELQKHLNEFENAEDEIKALAKKIIKEEEALRKSLKEYI